MFAGVVELVDTRDLKSLGSDTVPVRVRSPAPSGIIEAPNIAAWSSWQLVGLITRRSQVQVLPPQPNQKPLKSLRFQGFSFDFITFLRGSYLPLSPDPNRDPYGISERSGLETAREQASHRLGRLALGLRRYMGVGVQGEPGGEVSQHPGYRFHVHSILEGQGRECMP